MTALSYRNTICPLIKIWKTKSELTVDWKAFSTIVWLVISIKGKYIIETNNWTSEISMQQWGTIYVKWTIRYLCFKIFVIWTFISGHNNSSDNVALRRTKFIFVKVQNKRTIDKVVRINLRVCSLIKRFNCPDIICGTPSGTAAAGDQLCLGGGTLEIPTRTTHRSRLAQLPGRQVVSLNGSITRSTDGIDDVWIEKKMIFSD